MTHRQRAVWNAAWPATMTRSDALVEELAEDMQVDSEEKMINLLETPWLMTMLMTVASMHTVMRYKDGPEEQASTLSINRRM